MDSIDVLKCQIEVYEEAKDKIDRQLDQIVTNKYVYNLFIHTYYNFLHINFIITNSLLIHIQV